MQAKFHVFVLLCACFSVCAMDEIVQQEKCTYKIMQDYIQKFFGIADNALEIKSESKKQLKKELFDIACVQSYKKKLINGLYIQRRFIDLCLLVDEQLLKILVQKDVDGDVRALLKCAYECHTYQRNKDQQWKLGFTVPKILNLDERAELLVYLEKKYGDYQSSQIPDNLSFRLQSAYYAWKNTRLLCQKANEAILENIYNRIREDIKDVFYLHKIARLENKSERYDTFGAYEVDGFTGVLRAARICEKLIERTEERA